MTIERWLRDKINYACKHCTESAPDWSVYFVACGAEYVKIGITSCIENRLNTYNSSNPNKIELMAEIDMPNRNAAYILEQELLSRFSKSNVKGEWFRMDDNILRYAEKAKKIGAEIAKRSSRKTVEMRQAYIDALRGRIV